MLLIPRVCRERRRGSKCVVEIAGPTQRLCALLSYDLLVSRSQMRSSGFTITLARLRRCAPAIYSGRSIVAICAVASSPCPSSLPTGHPTTNAACGLRPETTFRSAAPIGAAFQTRLRSCRAGWIYSRAEPTHHECCTCEMARLTPPKRLKSSWRYAQPLAVAPKCDRVGLVSNCEQIPGQTCYCDGGRLENGRFAHAAVDPQSLLPE
jgi:hypothetical protein